MFECCYCKENFSKKFSLDRHYDSCKVATTMSIYDITCMFRKCDNGIEKDNMTINSLYTVNTKYLESSLVKKLLSDISKAKNDYYESLCSEYLHRIFNNKKYPENHCIKCINKFSKTYQLIVVKDEETLVIKKNFEDTSIIFLNPVTDIFQTQFQGFLKTCPEFDILYYKRNPRIIISSIFIEPYEDTILKVIKKFLELSY